MGRFPRSKRLVGVVAIVFVTSGCLWHTGPQTEVTYFGGAWPDAPDPAFAPLTSGSARVFTTNASFWGRKRNVPSFTITLPGGVQTGQLEDALPSLPDWATQGGASQTWAPSIRKVGSRYILMFSSERAGGNGQHCLGLATSTSLTGRFTPVHSFMYCGWSGWNYIDPQMFVDPSTSKVWLYFAKMKQVPAGQSSIQVQQMTANGLGLVGSPTTLLTFSRAMATPGLDPGSLGPKAVVENPAVVKDPYNGYDLLVSIGSYETPDSYHTLEIPCVFPNSPGSCLEAQGAEMATLRGRNPGGASLMRDDSPVGNWMAWHAGEVGSRRMYVSRTIALDPFGGL